MKTKSKQSGFSLIETLVAITILLIIIVGPMSITSQSARSTSFASEQVIAFFLAQEGVELMQKERDRYFNRHFLATSSGSYLANPWSNFKSSTLYNNCLDTGDGRGCGPYIVGDTSGSVQTISCSGSPCVLYFDDATASGRSRYIPSFQAGYEDTPYSREVLFETISADQIRVLSTVYWRSGNISDEQSITVESYLFNTYGE